MDEAVDAVDVAREISWGRLANQDSRPPSVEPSPRESRAPMQACGRGESSRLLGRGC